MKKKLILFGAGAVIALGAYFAYQYFTGADLTEIPGTKEVIAPDPTNQGIDHPYYENRTPEGLLESVMTAVRSKQIAAGQYRVEQPRILYYTHDDRVLSISSDTGIFKIDQLGPITSAKIIPKGATLSGNVRMTIGPKNSFVADTTELQPGQIQVRLEQDAEVDYSSRLLTSEGGIEVRGEKVWFNGRNLTVAFNNDQRRIEYLRIEEGNKIILKQVRSQLPKGDEAGPAATGPAPVAGAPVATAAAPSVPATAVATTVPAHPENQPNIYRLNFGRDVKAAIGEQSLTAQQMTVVFQTTSGAVANNAGKPAPAPTNPNGITASASDNTPPAATSPAATAPIVVPLSEPQVTDEDLVVTWTGPMEMRPDNDIKLANAKDAMIDATGAPGNPVVLRNGDNQSAKADHLIYQTAIQTVVLTGREGEPVEVADSTMGKMLCTKLMMVQNEGHIFLTGPGMVVADGTRSKTRQSATWGKGLELWMANVKDAKHPIIRRALFTGGAAVFDPTSRITADTLDVALAQGDQNGSQALEHVLADGHVNVETQRPNQEKADADTIAADHLELQTAPGAKGHPSPSCMIATGNVDASLHGSNTGKPTHQQIVTPKLVVNLEPKTSDAPKDDGLGAAAVTTVSAADGVEVKIDGMGAQQIVATSNTLLADARAGTATLVGTAPVPGKPNRDGWAVLRQGQNYLTSQTIELMQKTQSATVPGAGEFTFIQTSKKDEPPSPMNVRWAGKMVYDGKAHTASFTGPVVATMAGKADQHSTLTCDDLLVKLAAAEKTAEAPATQPGADTAKLRLDQLIATGNVQATGATLNAQGDVLNRLFLKAPELVYDDPTKVMTVPAAGELLLEDFRPEAAVTPAGNGGVVNTGGSRGSTAFRWSQSLTFNGDTNTIVMRKDVVMVHKPTKPLIAAKNGQPKGEGLVVLKTQELTTVLTQAKGAVSNPAALGSGGSTKLSHVTADGGSILTLDESELAADVLEFDADKNLAIAYGKNGNYATANRPEGVGVAERITWDVTQRDSGFTFILPHSFAQTP